MILTLYIGWTIHKSQFVYVDVLLHLFQSEECFL